MTVALGFNGSFGYAQSNLFGVHRDQTKWVALNEPPTFEPEIAQIDARLFTPGAYRKSIERLQGMFKCSGSFVMPLHPSEGVEFVKGVLGDVTSTELTGAGSGIYQHSFLGSNSVPMPKGFSLTIHEDIITKYISGVVVTSIEFGAEIDDVVTATVNWVGKKWETSAQGTAGTSQGGSAVSYDVVITEDSNDDFKLAIDGGAAYECTIAAATYSTAATLEAAINAAILAQTSLNDSEGVSEVACFIDSNDKLNFYTADKGTGAQVTYTAGTNDATASIGMGTPVEAAGTATLATATFSEVAPFVSTDMTVSQEGVDICVQSFTATFDAGLVNRNCLGHKYSKAVEIEKSRDIMLTFTKEYEDETAYNAWIANTDIEFQAALRTNNEIVAASGIDYDGNLYFKKCRINNTPEPSFEGQGAMKQEISATSYDYDNTYQDGLFEVNNLMSDMRDN